MTTSDIHSLSGAYALDAVDDLERVAFERHLRECDTCAMEVRELQATVARLADTAAVEPPPSLRNSVLEAVSRTPQVRAGRTHRGPATAGKRWQRFAAASVAAGVIAAGAGIGTWTVADRNVDKAREAAAAAQARASDLERVMAAPDVRVFKMTGRDGGTVNIAVARSLNSAVAVLNGLPDPGRGRVYQLWMVPEAGPSSAVSPGPLSIGQTAGSQLLKIGNAVQFAVSIEPESGSPKPSAEVIGLIGITS
jgi:anti-sigma-K factor RskA